MAQWSEGFSYRVTETGGSGSTPIVCTYSWEYWDVFDITPAWAPIAPPETTDTFTPTLAANYGWKLRCLVTCTNGCGTDSAYSPTLDEPAE